MTVSVIVPTTDRASFLCRNCVRSILEHTPGVEILVEEGSREEGYTAKINRGLARATGEFLVCSNDDVEVLPRWWEPLQDTLSCGLDVVFPWTSADLDGGEPFNRNDLAAWHFAFHRRTYNAMRLDTAEFLDPCMRIWYSDTDLLIRLRLAGFRVGRDHASQIRHGLSKTIGAWDCSAIVAADRAEFEAKWPAIVRQHLAVPV